MEAPDVFYTVVAIAMIAKIVARRGQVFLVSGFLLEPERDGGGGVRGHGWWLEVLGAGNSQHCRKNSGLGTNMCTRVVQLDHQVNKSSESISCISLINTQCQSVYN